MLSTACFPISFSTQPKLLTNFFVDAAGFPRTGCLQYLLCMSTWVKTLKAHTHTHTHTHTQFPCSISQNMIKYLQLFSKVLQNSFPWKVYLQLLILWSNNWEESWRVASHAGSVASVVSILCDPMDYSPPAFSVYVTLQVRILEGVVMASSRESSQSRD